MKDTILIVEDDRDIMEVVTIMLGREGVKVLKATNGKEAIKEISKKPDLIILDVMLPDMDGFTVCRRIREVSLAPVLYLSAKTGVQGQGSGRCSDAMRIIAGRIRRSPGITIWKWDGSA